MDSLFFWASKLIWIFISPDSLLILFFTFGVILLVKGKIRWATNVLVSLLMVFLFIGIFPVGEWLIYPLEKQYSSRPKLDRVDGIILLGGAEDSLRTLAWKQTVLNNAAERDLAFIELAKKYPTAKMIFTGGSGSITNQETKGADVAKQLFFQQGLNTSQIIFERESRNTWENAIFSKKLANPKAKENWILITTAWHMPRSMGIFCKAKWKVIPYPVDFRSNPDNLLRFQWAFSNHLSNLKIGIKEWVGITSYRLLGKMCKS